MPIAIDWHGSIDLSFSISISLPLFITCKYVFVLFVESIRSLFLRHCALEAFLGLYCCYSTDFGFRNAQHNTKKRGGKNLIYMTNKLRSYSTTFSLKSLKRRFTTSKKIEIIAVVFVAVYKYLWLGLARKREKRIEKVFVRLKFANCLVGLFRCLVSERMRMRWEPQNSSSSSFDSIWLFDPIWFALSIIRVLRKHLQLVRFDLIE